MMITPIRPTAVAIQRRKPTFSPRKMIDSAVTNSGETNPVAEASAIGRNRKPEMKNSDDAQQRHAAHQLQAGRLVCKRKQRRTRQHRRRHDQREHQEPDPGDLDRGQRRRQIFRRHIGGPRNTVEARISAMPLNGRSARAGAVRSGRISSRAKAMERCPAWRLRRGAGSRQSRRQELSNRARL